MRKVFALLMLFQIGCTAGKNINSIKSVNSTQTDVSIKKVESEHPVETDTVLVSQRQLMKDYALCRCITKAYNMDSAINNDISLSFYHEELLYPENMQAVVDSLSDEIANSIVPSKYPDYKGKRAVIYICTDFYKSVKLDSLIKSFDHVIKEME